MAAAGQTLVVVLELVSPSWCWWELVQLWAGELTNVPLGITLWCKASPGARVPGHKVCAGQDKCPWLCEEEK